MVESIHQMVERERKAAQPSEFHWEDIRTFRNYARGRQTSTLTADQRRILGVLTNNRFSDNVCRMILAAAASRLELIRFDVDNDAVRQFLEALWVKNQVADVQYDAHIATLRDGNHAIALRWQSETGVDDPESEGAPVRGAGRVTLHREKWWDGKTGVFVAYDEAQEPVYAVKDFVQFLGEPPRQRQRRTIYFPDHIERYIMQGRGWAPYPLAGEPSTGIVEWVKRDGTPLGIPVIHFANGSDDDTPYGASDLDGGILGLQDEINDIQRDITAAARLTGYQMYYGTGVEAEKDAQGNAKPLRVGPGQTLQSGNDKAAFGVLPAGDMGQLIKSHDLKLQTVSTNSQTPLHLIIGGEWPSGFALLRAEMPLISKAQRLAKTVGPSWATVGHRSTEIANTFGGLGLDENALVTAVFAPPEKLDELALVEIQGARVKMLHELSMIDDEILLQKVGFLTDGEITQLLADRERRAQQAAELAPQF